MSSSRGNISATGCHQTVFSSNLGDVKGEFKGSSGSIYEDYNALVHQLNVALAISMLLACGTFVILTTAQNKMLYPSLTFEFALVFGLFSIAANAVIIVISVCASGFAFQAAQRRTDVSRYLIYLTTSKRLLYAGVILFVASMFLLLLATVYQ